MNFLSALSCRVLLIAPIVACGSDAETKGVNPPATGEPAPPSGSTPPPSATAPSPTPSEPRPSKPPAPNAPNADILACQAGPLAQHPALPKLSLLFACEQQGRIVGVGVDGNFVYAGFASTEIIRVAATGGAPELLAYDPTPQVRVSMITVGPELFYIVERADKSPTEYEVRMIASAGTPPVIVTNLGANIAVRGIAQDATSVYLAVLTDIQTRLGKVIAIDKKTLVERDISQDVREPISIAVDATHVYVASSGVGVVRVPLAGGVAPETVLASPPMTRLGGVTVDASSVYVLDRGTYPQEEDGKFLRAPKSGGALSSFGLVVRGTGIPMLDGGDIIVASGKPPNQTPGADNFALRPIRYSPVGTTTELISPMLAQVQGTTMTSDASALYFGTTSSTSAVARLER